MKTKNYNSTKNIHFFKTSFFPSMQKSTSSKPKLQIGLEIHNNSSSIKNYLFGLEKKIWFEILCLNNTHTYY